MVSKIEMVITDLDGTLFNNEQIITGHDYDTLVWLGEQNISRVIATGRNLYSAKKVLPENIPVDYLVFSTGAGVIDLHTGDLIYTAKLQEKEVRLAAETLKSAGMSFMVHDLVPDNHSFLYFDAKCGTNDFKRRCELYSEFAAPMDINAASFKHASQLLAIVPEDLSVLEHIRDRLKSLRVVRTTSPLDGKSMWIEIFPANVSKGHTTEWLCSKTGINQSGTIGIGNDYNDLDLLKFVKYPFMVNNAPESLKKLFMSCKSNNENGFSDAVYQILTQNKT